MHVPGVETSSILLLLDYNRRRCLLVLHLWVYQKSALPNNPPSQVARRRDNDSGITYGRGTALWGTLRRIAAVVAVIGRSVSCHRSRKGNEMRSYFLGHAMFMHNAVADTKRRGHRTSAVAGSDSIRRWTSCWPFQREYRVSKWVIDEVSVAGWREREREREMERERDDPGGPDFK